MKNHKKIGDKEKVVKYSKLNEIGAETMLCHYGEKREKNQGAVVPPIYQNSLFTFESWEEIDRAFSSPVDNCIYTRGNNPTTLIVEQKLAALAGGEKAKLFSSGMGAISSAIMHFVKEGDHCITINNVYGPTSAFFKDHLKEKCGIETTFVSGESLEEFQEAIRENTKLIYLESPSSAMFTLQDIKGVAELAKKHNVKTIIDNTWATPLFQKALEMGIDIEVHSCSKYINGHSDVVAGVAIGKKEDIEAMFYKEHALYGSKIAPFESWLIMRSLRTLPARMRIHQENALKVAQFLENHPKIKRVMYPGLTSFPQKELADRQMEGFSGLFAFEIDSEDLPSIKEFVNSLEFFSIGVSWGGHESLIFAPAIAYLKEMTEEHFKKTGLKLGIMRVSIGLENSEDLIRDLSRCLELIKK